MKIGPRGIAIIKDYERLSLVAYKCPAGRWTIGWGHTLNVRRGMAINEAEAKRLLLDDLQAIENTLADPRIVKVPLNQNQIDAFGSLIFNIGIGHFRRSDLLADLNNKNKLFERIIRHPDGRAELIKLNNYQQAAERILQWHHIKHKNSHGLSDRRRREYDLFLEPIETSKPV